MKATVLAESSIMYFIFSPGSLRYGDVCRSESGNCHILSFFLRFYLVKYPFFLLQVGQMWEILYKICKEEFAEIVEGKQHVYCLSSFMLT